MYSGGVGHGFHIHDLVFVCASDEFLVDVPGAEIGGRGGRAARTLVARREAFDVAVVLSGRGAVGAYREVAQFVTAAPVSVLGYTVMRGLVFVLGVLLPLTAVGGVMSTAGVGDLTTAVVLGLLALLILPLVTTFLYVYHVAYYQRRQRAPIV